MKVVITGASGFIGSELVQRLNHNSSLNVIGLERHSSVAEKKLILTAANVVIHLAGIMRDTNIQLHKGNTDTTIQLLENIRRYCPNAKLIFASSSQAHDSKSLYGLTKRYAETLIEWYSYNYGIRSIIFRFPNIYGPFCKPFYNSVVATYIYESFYNRQIIIHGNGKQLRDFLYVTDVVSALEKAIFYKSIEKIEHFNLSSGTLHSIIELVTILEKIYGKTIDKRLQPTEKQQNAKIPLSLNTLRKKLHWKPLVSFEKGLRNILKYQYKKYQ